MPRTIISIPITRAGAALHGSPFQTRGYIGKSWTGNGSEVAPRATKETSRAVLSFVDIGADIRIGDLLTYPDGAYGRIVNVRTYERSLQCDIQIIPYVNVRLWTPSRMTDRVTPSKDVLDVGYVDAGLILAYLDPMKDETKMAIFGTFDVPMRYCYSLQSIAQKSILMQANGTGWMAETTSEEWEPANDLRCMVRKQERLPAGVTV